MATPALVRLLLDTSYCLFLIRTRPRLVQVAFEHYRPGEIAVSSLTVAALEAFARRSSDPVRNRRALEQFLLPLVVVDFDADAARCLGRIGGEAGFGGVQAAHTLLLAAQALRLNATLVTTQPALYAGIDGVTVRAGLGMEEQLVPLPVALPAARDDQRTIRLSGSHDLSLTLLGDWLHAEHPDLRFAVTNVGSLLGLVALMQHEAHLAGSHLLDEETGDFNIGPVRRLLGAQGLHVVILGFVARIQGILVARGNPKQIGGLTDLQRDDVTFVNRQGGAGTRILLDYQLHKLGIEPAQVRGYAREETTHLAVATAVAQGAADCGMGIQAAAQALNVDFIPIVEERFDLVIPVEHFESALLAPLLALLRRRDTAFRNRVTALGGYNTQPMGRVMAEM
jgi:molybdate-binding protein/predicted nucleic acid-binding protein